MKNRGVKFFLLGLGAVIVFPILVLLILPVFWNVDHVRPRVQEELNKTLRSPVELGAFSIQLFPKFRFSIDSVRSIPQEKWGSDPLVTTGRFSLEMSLLSLLRDPQVDIKISQPKLVLVKSEQTSNLGDLLPAPVAPDAGARAPTPIPEKAVPPAVGTLLESLPGFLASRVKAARIHFEVIDARFDQRDLKQPETRVSLPTLNLKLRDVGIAAPMSLEMDALLQFVAGDLKADGPLRAKGVFQYDPKGAAHFVQIDSKVDLKDLVVEMGPLFSKKAGSAFDLSAKGQVEMNAAGALSASFKDLGFQFGAFVLSAELTGQNLQDPTSGEFDFKAESNEFELSSFGVFVPLVRDYSLTGQSTLKLNAKGPLLNPEILMNLSFERVGGSTPALKKPLSDLKGQIRVAGTAKSLVVDVKPLSMKLGSGDLSLESKILGPWPARVDFVLNSSNLDVDELMGLQPLRVDAGAAASQQADASSPPAGAAAASSLPLDESLHQMAPQIEAAANNPLLGGLSIQGRFKLNRVRALGGDFREATGELVLKDKVFELKPTRVDAYSGKASLGMRFDLRQPKSPGFAITGQLQNIDFGALLATHAPSWKNDFQGRMNGQLNLSGSGLTREQLSQNLGGQLTGSLEKGRLRLPLVKIVGLVMEKLPKVVGKNVDKPSPNQKFQGDFKTALMDLRFKGRSLQIQNVDVVYDTLDPKMGDLRFLSKSGRVTFDQKVDLEGVAFLSPEIVRIGELKGPSGQIELPLRLKGPMTDASPDIEYTLGILGPRVAKNLLQGRAGQEAKKAVAKEAEKQLDKVLQKSNPEVKKKADDLKKQLKKRLGF